MNSLGTNESGALTIGGISADELARQYGTPLYIMDEDAIRENCRVYINAFKKAYGGNFRVVYACKAFCCKHMCKIVEQEGLELDVCSAGELYTAIKAEFPMDRIYFHGNNKAPEEIELALRSGVGRIVVDNFDELYAINEIAGRLGKRADISFRIKPGIDAHTHEFVRTGQIDSKFGVALENGESEEIMRVAAALPNVTVVGVHCHIGSQIFDYEPFALAAKVMMNFIADMRDKHGIHVTELNLGGGYGVKYVDEDNPVPYEAYINDIAAVIKDVAQKRDFPLPTVVIEPGRSIVAAAGITVYTVGMVKDIPGVRKYVAVDGGMADNPRYIMYQAKYDAALVKAPNAPRTEVVTVAGKSCESGDILIKDIALPPVAKGDSLAVLGTGAYNYSMSSNYNRLPRPAVVMISKGKSRVVVQRETLEDLIRNDE